MGSANHRQLADSLGSIAWMLLGVACTLVTTTTSAHAFSDFNRYAEPTSEGGTAGRHFTGSPIDGYGCDTCHQGGEGIEVDISGLPLDGYQAGATYEITLRFLHPDPHVALLLEFGDEQRQPAGTLGPPDPQTIPPEEFCIEEGEMTIPALQPVSTEEGRTLLAVADCGARAVRFQWTAPAGPVGTIWMTGGVVNSNTEEDPEGDGVTLIRRPLLSGAGQTYAHEVASGCQISPGSRATGGALTIFFLVTTFLSSRTRLGRPFRRERLPDGATKSEVRKCIVEDRE